MNQVTEMSPWQVASAEFVCCHEHTQFTKFVKSNDVVCVRIQCTRCGENIKEVSKKGHDTDTLPRFDETLRRDWWQAQQDRSSELQQEKLRQIEAERANQDAMWWQKYNRYLRSQQWHDMRKHVLQRDNDICQACLRNKATQVHHLSYKLYEQTGQSFAFELVAICRTCHHAIHPHMAEAQDKLALHNPYLSGGHYGRR